MPNRLAAAEALTHLLKKKIGEKSRFLIIRVNCIASLAGQLHINIIVPVV